jgi:uncharacterized protein (TIGR03086 family)
VLALHRQVVCHTVDLVLAIRGDQWDLPTPCTQWTVRRLVEHMVRENRGFAAAARGETVDRSAWTSPVGPDPRTHYAASAQRVVVEFGAEGVLGRTFWLPLIGDGVTIPARQAVGFHLVDYVVHAWDVAVSTGLPTAFPDEIVAAAYGIALREVPVGPRRHRPNASFAPPVALPEHAPTMDRLLGFLGRDPQWQPRGAEVPV